MKQEKVFIGINEQEANFLVDNLKPKGFQVNKVGMNNRFYVAVDQVNDHSSLLTLSALVLNLFKKRILTDALSDVDINSDDILKIINDENAWNLLSEDSITILYSDVYQNLNNSQIIDVSFTSAKHYANRRKCLSEEVKSRLGSVAQ